MWRGHLEHDTVMVPSSRAREQVSLGTANYAVHRIVSQMTFDRAVRLRKECIPPVARSPRARDIDFRGKNLIGDPGVAKLVVPGVPFLGEVPDGLAPDERSRDGQCDE